MKCCSVCGNAYDKLIKITYQGRTEVFDSFECAIHSMAPKCAGCGLSVIGHGTEVDDVIFCSAHCARTLGKYGLVDRMSENSMQGNTEL